MQLVTQSDPELRQPLSQLELEPRTSQILKSLVAQVGRKDVSISWLLQRMRLRAYGFALLLFSIPSCLPTPPGVATVCGIILLVVTAQMIVGLEPLRLPRILARRKLSKDDVARFVARAVPWVERVERIARPRLGFMTGPVGYRLVGVVVMVLSFIVTLPIPVLGNMPPAVATIVIALGLTERDGLIVLLGLIVSVAALAFSGTLAVEAIGWLFRVIGG